ncbi:cytochrome-c peroxidase [Methylobacter psychrophilus]|uniref:cytochrome-c peroxidase n=1 Tax=Methylobacter psychrophilus TaxID=96941 RepID=UPI0021D4AE3D|nr:cytochrome c peroxidase [Methylobacter psychrophilus]
MNTVFKLSRKGLTNLFEWTVFLGVTALLVTFTQPAMAAVASKPTALQVFCAANAMDRVNFPEVPGSLKCTPVPEPYMVDGSGNKVSISPSIIKNKAALIALGKMLFWDSQVGSDGIACASCHFQAGADNRIKNQIDPGLRNAGGKFASDGITPIGKVFDFMASYPNTTNLDPLLPTSGKGPNYTLTKKDFPLRQYQEPQNPVAGQALQADRNAQIVYDSDDVVSSQGVYYSTFNGLTPSGKKELCKKRFPKSGPDMPLFNVGGRSVRQVEPRNTPTIINAVYNFRNFWDGRANNVFNGLDPFGLRRFADPLLTPSDEIYRKNANGKLVKNRITIYNSSLASQAVGPALSDFEMSCGGKDFSELGKKILAVKPLGKQKVDVSDSVLGPYTNTAGNIKPVNTYKLLIQSAFNNAYWDVSDTQTVDGYKLIENNFSLFWGLAVQAYESTLVSDDSRFDQAINGRDKLTDQEQRGLNLFVNQGKCIACHLGSEFTSASVTHVENVRNVPEIGKYTLRMLMGDGGIALYDEGFYNIGVRPTEEDLGVGATDGYGYPLSFTRNAKNKANDPFDYSIAAPNISSLFPDPFQNNSFLFANLGCISWNPVTSNWGYLCGTDPVVSDERDAVDGAFKTSTLRNVELTGPYFHNGGQATLEQVVQFYNRGGDRKDLFLIDSNCGGALLTIDAYGNSVVATDPVTGLMDNSGFLKGSSGQASNMSPDMAGTKELLNRTCNPGQSSQETLGLSSSDVDDMVAFMKSLTDERVRWEKAPFDHPSLTIPNGHVGDENKVKLNPAVEQSLEMPAVGAAGRKSKGLPALQSFDIGLK